MSTLAVDLTFLELTERLRQAIRDRSYQQSRLGASIAAYLAWRTPSAARRTLEIDELYLAAMCVKTVTEHGDLTVHEITAPMLMAAAEQHPVGSYRLVRTTYSGFFTWAEDWEELARSPVRRMPKARKQKPRIYDIFSAGEQAQLIKAGDALPLPWVQRLRILTFIDLGIRQGEARLLQPRDVDTTARVVVIRHAKGEKQRVVPFGDDFFRAFVTFMNRPIPAVRMQDERGAYMEARQPLNDDYLFFPLGFLKRTGVVTWTDPFRPLAPRAMGSWWEKVTSTAEGVSI